MVLELRKRNDNSTHLIPLCEGGRLNEQKNINSPSKIIKRIIDTPSSHIHKKTDMLNLKKKNMYLYIKHVIL